MRIWRSSSAGSKRPPRPPWKPCGCGGGLNDLELLQPRVVGALLRFARFEPGGEPADQSAHDGMQVLPLDEVTRIQVRKSAAGKGAVIGLVVGGVSRSLNSLCLLRGAFTLSKLVLFVIGSPAQFRNRFRSLSNVNRSGSQNASKNAAAAAEKTE
jgi:hypothetical protein